MDELQKHQWYADRKGENPPGKKQYYMLPIFNYYKVSICPALLAGLMSCTYACLEKQDPSLLRFLPRVMAACCFAQVLPC